MWNLDSAEGITSSGVWRAVEEYAQNSVAKGASYYRPYNLVEGQSDDLKTCFSWRIQSIHLC